MTPPTVPAARDCQPRRVPIEPGLSARLENGEASRSAVEVELRSESHGRVDNRFRLIDSDGDLARIDVVAGSLRVLDL